MTADPKDYVKTIDEQQVELEGGKYFRVLFRRCQVIYSGGDMPVMSGCFFEDCTWHLHGPAARTLEFMRQMHKAGLRPVAENWIREIRGEPEPAQVKAGPEAKH